MTAAGPSQFVSSLPLVEAKLRPPVLRPATIARNRLLRPLLAERGARHVAVIAAPGYGKTTLLAQWAAREPRPVAWLTLDDMDNDPVLLVSYLATALARIGRVDGAIRTAIGASRGRILAAALPRLLGNLARWEQPGVLILDDAHRLVDQTALDAVTILLDHMPPGFRVAIAARTQPELALARMRAAGELLEIGPGQLALTDEETAAVIAADDHQLGPQDVRAVRARTEGWAAGIHLAALAIARGEEPAGSLDTISGRDRYFSAYFRSEFERNLEPEDIVVLTRSAILETITPNMAEAVTGVEGAWERLARIARRSLFVQDVGADRAALRYHTLLRDFLLGELHDREPGARAELHRRAAAAHARAHELQPAVEQAFASGDLDAITAHTTAAILPTFFGGHPATVDGWVQRLDDAAFHHHPPLAVIAAWIHLLNGRPEVADRLADSAERATYTGPTGDGSASFESQLAMLQAMMARHGPADAMAKASFAVRAEARDSPWRGTALGVLGGAFRMLGQPAAAEDAFAAGAAAGNMVCAGLAAAVALERGDWEAAEGMAARARDMMAAARFDELLQSIVVRAVGARVAIHRGDLTRARDDLVKAQHLRTLASFAAPWLVVDSLLHLARAYLALADIAGAQVIIREAEAIVRHRPGIGVLTAELVTLRQQLADARDTLLGCSALTAAELRLLPFLPTYLSFQEIADRLGVSRNTVKSQGMSLYGKLQASSRSEAVERAVEFGLLEPFPGLAPAGRRAPD